MDRLPRSAEGIDMSQRTRRRPWGRVVLLSALAAVVISVLAPSAVHREPTARAWDSIPGLSSHTAITENAIDDILNDPSQPAAFRDWVGANRDIFETFSGSNLVTGAKRGELVHAIKRPLDPVVANECDPFTNVVTPVGQEMLAPENTATGASLWAVGNNPGSTHPEYWWQTALCLQRAGYDGHDDNHPAYAEAVLGQLLHQIADQGAPPHATFKMHGGVGEDQWFEYLAATSLYDTDYYRHPDSVLYPGKNVLDGGNGAVDCIGTHCNGDRASFSIPKDASKFARVSLAPNDANDPYPTILQTPSPTQVRVDVALPTWDLTGDPEVTVAALFETADGGYRYQEQVLELGCCTWAHMYLDDQGRGFAENGRLWLSTKRNDEGTLGNLVGHTGEVQVYVTNSKDVRADVAKPALRNPWEYYDFLRQWTQWNLQSPYWRRYFAGLNSPGDLVFSMLDTPNAEMALLSLQWHASQLVTEWVLEDAYRLFNDPAYTVDAAGGSGYRVAFYDDENFNSNDDGDSPEEIRSYGIGCEPYEGSTCGSFIAPDRSLPHPLVGDGLFTASGTGPNVTMKANSLDSVPPGDGFLGGRISSIEVRNATVYLFSGKNLTGDVRTITADTPNLTTVGFNDATESVRIVPAGVTSFPTARDDHASVSRDQSGHAVPVAVPVTANDDAGGSGTTVLRLHTAPAHGAVKITDSGLVYTPNDDYTTPWPSTDSFTYDLVDANGISDTATVEVSLSTGDDDPVQRLRSDKPRRTLQFYGSGFGESVALSGDGLTAFVGSPAEGGDGVNVIGAGAVFAYSRDDLSDSFAAPTKLTDGDTPYFQFGAGVALSGDGNVGLARSEGSEDQGRSGRTLAYVRSGGRWGAAQPILTSPANGASYLGGLALDEDGTVAAVGDPGAQFDEAENRVGTVRVFARSEGTFTETQRFDTPIGEGAANQGMRVAVSRDGLTMVFNSNSAVYVTSRSSEAEQFGTPIEVGSVVHANHLALSGDGSTLLLGQLDQSTIWTRTADGGFTEQQTINAPEGSANFGDCTVNGGGGNCLALSTNGDRAFIADSFFQACDGCDRDGRVFVFERTGTSWELTDTMGSPRSGSQFGYSVATDDEATATIVGAVMATETVEPTDPIYPPYIATAGNAFVFGQAAVQDTVPPVLAVPADVTVTATSASGATVDFEVSALDAVDGVVPVVCEPPSGSVFPLGATSVDCSAHDAAGNSASGSFVVTVEPPANQPPVATIDSSPVVGDPRTIAFDGSRSTDPDGRVVDFAWDFGDGTVGTGSHPQHSYPRPGSYTVELEVTDDGGATGTTTSVIEVMAPPAPIANPDTYRAVSGRTLSVAAPGPLGNDVDPEGAALTATLATATESGELTLNADGSFTYTPTPGFTGTDHFTYTATGPVGAVSEPATVTITVDPPPPCEPLTSVNTVTGTALTTEGGLVTVDLRRMNLFGSFWVGTVRYQNVARLQNIVAVVVTRSPVVTPLTDTCRGARIRVGAVDLGKFLFRSGTLELRVADQDTPAIDHVGLSFRGLSIDSAVVRGDLRVR
jgi:hypothetical protein